jgi:NodT family efflux transporter outer membrane factor (OMF) lipoprotein
MLKPLPPFILIASGVLLLGCAVGPDYQKPESKTPPAWLSANNKAPNAPTDTQVTIEETWWKNFNDPVLSQLIDKALLGNYDLKIAEARIEQARAARGSAFAALLPTGDAKAGVTRAQLPPALAFPGLSNPLNIYQADIDASWELDLFGGHRRALEGATYDVEASEATLADARVSLLAEVARTYVDICKYQTELKITSDIVAADQNTVDLTKERATGGDVAGIDATQAEAQLETEKAQVPVYQSLLAQTEFSMDLLLGEQPGATQSLVGATTAIPVSDKTVVLAAPAAVIDHRPDIRIAERQLASATAQQGVAAAQFYPDISLSGFLGLINPHISDLLTKTSTAWMMGSSVTWPILSYGSLAANQESADAHQKEALATYQKTVLAAFADVEKAVTAYTKEQDYRDAFAQSVDKNREASAVAKQRYENGLTSFLETLDADRTLYNSEIQLAEANAMTSEDLISVYKSLGGGWQAGMRTTSSSQD